CATYYDPYYFDYW
nr:immunoglobulin heavy chain junction region [Mus musculus]MBK4195135.1 immunoglobulin heavy chain junction region [Mus musculus]